MWSMSGVPTEVATGTVTNKGKEHSCQAAISHLPKSVCHGRLHVF